MKFPGRAAVRGARIGSLRLMRATTVELNADRNVTLEITGLDLPPAGEGESPFEHPRPAIIICPGGGFEFLSPREADPVAVAFQRFGFATFILRYSIREHAEFPHPAVDVLHAIRWVRAHADELGVDPAQVAVMGFSAGGHVAALAGTQYANPAVLAAERAEVDAALLEHSPRPDAIVPAYALFNFDWIDDAPADAVDTIADVHPAMPPAFVWTTGEDVVVPPSQSLRFVNALAERGVPFEYHHFTRGVHGLSTADRLANADRASLPENAHAWVELCANWLRATLDG